MKITTRQDFCATTISYDDGNARLFVSLVFFMSTITTHDTATELTAEEPQEEATVARKPWVRFVRTNPVIRWFLLPLVISALVMTLGYIVRTQAFLGPAIGSIIERQAQKHQIDLFVQDVRPKGFFGVRLTQVRARVQRGHYLLDAQLDAVDINPDIIQSIKQGKPIPGAIDLNKGTVTLKRVPSRKSAQKTKAKTTKSNSLLNDLKIVGRDVEVLLEAGQSFKSTRPMKMNRIEASIAWQKDPLPQTLKAYGTLPDGTPFSLSTKPSDETKSARVFVLKPQQKTRIDRWFAGQLPFQMSVDHIDVCVGCQQDEMRFEQVWLTLPTFGKGLDITAKKSKVQWDRGKASLLLPGVYIEGLHDDSHRVQLTQTEFMFDTKSGSHSGDLTLKETSGGVMGVSWLWDGPQQLLSGTIEAKTFSLAPFFGLWGTNAFFKQGTLHGTLDGTLDLNHHLLHTNTKMTIQDARAHWPRLSEKPIDLRRVHVQANTLMDIKSKSLNVLGASIQLGKTKPISLQGNLHHAKKGWSFGIDILGAQIDAQGFKEALPKVLTEGIAQTKFAGQVGLVFHASGHTEFAESLRLKLKIMDDLSVVHDDLNVAKLNAEGAPNWAKDKFSPPLDPKLWVNLADLDATIPKTLTAAEDAQFYRHNGFDPLGFERAMVHNLRVKRMERGGSTITQQVVKNIFLSTKRTLARKLQEAYLTWHIEKQLPKSRILELYFNIAEWGPGVRGLGQAAQYYFGKNALELTIEEVALLGTILPGPKIYGRRIKAGHLPSSRFTKFEHILANLRFLGMIEYSTYKQWMNGAKQGKIAGLNMTLCADDDTAPKGTPTCKSLKLP